MRTFAFIVLIHVAIGVFLWIKTHPLPEYRHSSKVATSDPIVQQSSTPPPQTEVAEEPSRYSPAASPKPMARWTAYADGYTWVSATEEEKRALVRELARASRHGNSEDYFYDALEAFYAEASLRKEKLGGICDLIESGSQVLPARMRSY